MKISILTATYNRANLLPQLYKSLKDNLNCKVDFEWLIMDDGSSDDTKKTVEQFINEKLVNIKYYYQQNQGKMVAINNLVPKADGDLIIECDSDDFFTEDAFEVIEEEYEKNKDEKDIYALCFLKYDTSGKNMGRDFKKEKTTMFDLYFKEGEDGEKALVYFSNIRKKYTYKLEHNEKFVTEARMHHEMDLNYKVKCINKAIMICEYQDEGYSKNIIEQFKKNPYGYYEYFKEILERNFSGVSYNKKLYSIKHYILFSYLTKQYQSKTIKSFSNKLLYYILLIPGIIKSKKLK